MVNHSEFYYLNKHESSQYSQKPPGYLSVERLIKNQPPWKKYSLAKKPKPKALILTDWTAEGWSEDKLAAVKSIFNQLIDDGFPLYVWQNREIIALSKETLHVLDNPMCRQQISPVASSVLVEEALKQHQLTRDKIHSLDDYWIDALLNVEDINPERTLSVATFNSSTHKESDIISLLRQSRPPLTQIIHDEYSVKSHKNTLKLQKHFPNAIVSTHYRAVCSNEHFELAEHFDFPKLHSSDLPNIHCYSYNNNQASVLKTVLSSDLHRLLSSLPALKTLDLTGVQLKGSFIDPFHMLNLEKLRIEYSDISSDPLRWLLNGAPQLKILHIHDYNHNIDVISPISLPHLEDLKLISRGLDFGAYESILQATNLKRLNLCFLSGLDNLLLSRYNLSHLEELTLNRCSFENLSSVLANAPHLKYLSLSTTDVASKPTTPFPPLENLETFVFTNINQNEVNSVAILSAAKHLKTLQLSSFRTFPLIPLTDTMKDALATLEHLELTNNHITGKELHALLAATPALKKITLNDNEHLDDFDMDGLSLKYLEELEISQSNIRPTELLKMISNAPNLKVLRIHFYEMDMIYPNNFHPSIALIRLI